MNSGRLRSRTDEVCILKGKTDKNAGFVSYDLASEVIIPLLDDCGVIWKDYGGKVNLFSFNFIIRNSTTVNQYILWKETKILLTKIKSITLKLILRDHSNVLQFLRIPLCCYYSCITSTLSILVQIVYPSGFIYHLNK